MKGGTQTGGFRVKGGTQTGGFRVKGDTQTGISLPPLSLHSHQFQLTDVNCTFTEKFLPLAIITHEPSCNIRGTLHVHV